MVSTTGDARGIAVVVPLPGAGREFQLVWAMTEAAPEGLEADYRAARAEAARGLAEVDHLRATCPLEVQVELPLHGRGCDASGRGGAHAARNPEVDHLVRIASMIAARGRWRGPNDEGAEDVDLSDLPAAELAERLPWIHLHRGREGGPSPRDYAAQREWSRCRSVSIGWWMRQSAAGYRLPDVPPGLAPLLGRSWVRRALLGMAIDAAKGGWFGFTASAPELAAYLGVSISTIWDALRWLESRGLIVRLRRYKPGRDGRPVELAANWYGPGPSLLDRANLWLQVDLEGWRAVRVERAKRRGRMRRDAARRSARRRGVLPAPIFVDRGTWVASVLESADRWSAYDQARRAVDEAACALQEARMAAFAAGRFEWVEAPPVCYPRRPEFGDQELERVLRVARAVDQAGGLAAVAAEADAAGAAIAAYRERTGRDDEGEDQAGYMLELMVARLAAAEDASSLTVDKGQTGGSIDELARLNPGGAASEQRLGEMRPQTGEITRGFRARRRLEEKRARGRSKTPPAGTPGGCPERRELGEVREVPPLRDERDVRDDALAFFGGRPSGEDCRPRGVSSADSCRPPGGRTFFASDPNTGDPRVSRDTIRKDDGPPGGRQEKEDETPRGRQSSPDGRPPPRSPPRNGAPEVLRAALDALPNSDLAATLRQRLKDPQ